ncbi:5-guanidino-2-oxopentanoate decarboxylase [Nesterenkonia halophila]
MTPEHAAAEERVRRLVRAVPAAERTGGLAVVAALAAHGTDIVFGIPGTHNLEIYRHLTTLDVRVVTPRHEQGAGYAADGHHLVTGRPGVVITTTGPALTNVLTAAATAHAESRPLLVVSPGMPVGTEGTDLGRLHETKDASGAADRLMGSSRRVATAEEAVDAVAEAFDGFARRRPRPVHLEVPLDVLEGPWSGRLPEQRSAGPAELRADTSAEPVRTAAARLAAAQEPLIVAGGGGRGAGPALQALAERIDAPVVTTANGKGVLAEDHPLSLGADVRRAAVQRASRSADVLLVVGSELGDSDLWGGTIGAAYGSAPGRAGESAEDGSQAVIRLDIDPAQLHKNLPGDVVLAADAGAGLRALVAELPSPRDRAGTRGGDAEDPATAARTTPGRRRAATLRGEVAEEFDRTATLPRVTTVIQQAAGDDVIVAGDSSQVTYDGTVHALRARGADQLLYMPGHATLGYGIPAAVGAQIGVPDRPVVALVGDGAAMFTVQEIVTAVEQRLPVVIVIADNGGYGEIEAQMRQIDVPPVGVRLASPDFAALGRAMGARGAAVDVSEEGWEDRLGTVVSDGLGAEGPTVVHLRL